MEKKDLNKEIKTNLIKDFDRNFIMPFIEERSINGRKKIATYETILRFYQNAILTFALESHKHYAQDIVEDREHNFVTEEEKLAIHKFMNFRPVSKEQIDSLFKKL